VSDIARIVIRLPNWLGDALMARPLLHALARRYPGAERTAIGPGAVLDLLAPDRVFEHARELASFASTSRPAPRPDLALVLPPSFSSAFQAWRLGARRRVGFAGDARDLLLTRAVRRAPRGDRHLSEEYLDLLGDDDATDVAPPPLPVAAEASAAARDAARREFAEAGRVALLAPGAIYGPAKRWPAERFAELARRLARRGFAVLVCGAEADRAVCDEVAAAGEARSLAGQLSLATQAGLCAAAALAVCNDSGFAHLSAAVGAPTVAVFGSTSSAWTAPRGARVRVVQHPPVCAPCFQRTCAIGYRCLTAIAVGDVERACAELAA